VDNPLAQRVHQENAERKLQASFITGLTGVPGRQFRYADPQTLKEALRRALSVPEAERQEKFRESFYASFDTSVRLSQSPEERTPEMRSHDTQRIRARAQRYRIRVVPLGQRPRAPDVHT